MSKDFNIDHFKEKLRSMLKVRQERLDLAHQSMIVNSCYEAQLQGEIKILREILDALPI